MSMELGMSGREGSSETTKTSPLTGRDRVQRTQLVCPGPQQELGAELAMNLPRAKSRATQPSRSGQFICGSLGCSYVPTDAWEASVVSSGVKTGEWRFFF